LKEEPQPDPENAAPSTRIVTSRRPNHVWHIDLTAVPTSAGFWAPWLPFALPQCWPFCWWVAVVIDHYSRRVVGLATFGHNPTTLTIQSFLESANAVPKYVICDKGQQFWCGAFKDWCGRQGITPHFGAVGQHGSIALVERFILSLKNECTRVIIVPFRSESFRRELRWYTDWFNQDRPHSALDGKTPHEVYYKMSPACERPRYEPRARWPRSAPCASPHAPVAGIQGALIRLDVRYDGGRKHLPIVGLRLAA
jgi:putative transposase